MFCVFPIIKGQWCEQGFHLLPRPCYTKPACNINAIFLVNIQLYGILCVYAEPTMQHLKLFCVAAGEFRNDNVNIVFADVLAPWISRASATMVATLHDKRTVETLYNTVNFCWSTHKRHSIARPKGRGMGCLLWVQRATYCVDLSKLSSIKYLL